MNLNQTEFAALGGVTLGSQTRYETGDQVPKTDYIHGIALHGVDVLYVLTGRRDAEAGLSEAASELLTIFHSLPQNMQRASLAILQALRDESETDRTLHQPKTNFHAE